MFNGVGIDGLIRSTVHRQVSLPITVEIERVEGDGSGSDRLLNDSASDRLSPAGGADDSWQTDIYRDEPDVRNMGTLLLGGVEPSIITSMISMFALTLHTLIFNGA